MTVVRTLSFKVTSPAPRDVWEDLLKSDVQALISQTPAWLDCICAMGDHEDASRLYETAEGRQLVLPMVRDKGLPAALTTEASLPHGWGSGGLVTDGCAYPHEITAVLAELASRSVLRTSVRPHPLAADSWTATAPPGAVEVPHVTHVLKLEGDFEWVWMKRFSSKTRNKIRKAERSGLVIECDTSGKLVPVFYDLYLRWLEHRARQRSMPLWLARWRGQRREPLRKFQLVAQALGDACRILVAWRDGRPVASSILLIFGANAIYWRNASDRELAGPTRANDLLQRMMIEDACLAGCQYYHMGESGGVASLMHFKQRFGARAHRYVEYRCERLPISRMDNWLHGLLRRVEDQMIHRGSHVKA